MLLLFAAVGSCLAAGAGDPAKNRGLNCREKRKIFSYLCYNIKICFKRKNDAAESCGMYKSSLLLQMKIKGSV